MSETLDPVGQVRDPDTAVPIRCACGSAEVVCYDAGDSPIYSEAGHILVRAGRPASGKCLRCWLPPVGTQLGLF